MPERKRIARRGAERLTETIDKNMRQTRIQVRELDVDNMDRQARMIRIGEDLGQRINDLTVKTARGIADAQREATDAIAELPMTKAETALAESAIEGWRNRFG